VKHHQNVLTVDLVQFPSVLLTLLVGQQEGCPEMIPTVSDPGPTGSISQKEGRLVTQLSTSDLVIFVICIE